MVQFEKKEQENEKLREYVEKIQKEIEDTYRGKLVSFDFSYNTNNRKGDIYFLDKNGTKYSTFPGLHSSFPFARNKLFRSWTKTENKIHAICSKKMNPIVNEMENTDKYWFYKIHADYENNVTNFVYLGTRGNF